MAERIAPPTPRAALDTACAALKVFPLHGVAVLPGTPTPFHIFEARYKALFTDALRGDRVVAVPGLVSKEGAHQLRPAIYPIAGACIIEQEERYDDGRYDVVLRGIARVRLLEELPGTHLYREFRAEVLDDIWPAAGPQALAPGLESLRQLVYQLAQRLPEESGAPALAEAVSQMKDAAAIADLVAAAAVSDPEDRQKVLEELEVGKRLERVIEEVAGVVLVLSKGQNPRA
jgi:uncharacterized protein